MKREKSKTNLRSEDRLNYQLPRLLWLLIVPFSFFLSTIANNRPYLTETVFSQALYPFFSTILGFLFGWFPLSVAELAIYAVLVLVPVLLIIYFIRWILQKISFVKVLGLMITYLIIAGLLFSAFYFLWGFNYSRPKLAELMNLNPKPRPAHQLEALGRMLADEAKLLRPLVAEDENGGFVLPEGYRPYFEKIVEAYKQLGQTEPQFSRKVYPAKGILASKALSYSGISGIFMPFTGEPNVNVDQPPLLLLSSAAHESAHFLGIAREDEANFIAYLACIQSEDPSIRYSGIMHALITSGNKLRDADSEAYAALRSMYSEGMKRDLANYSAYWKQFEGPMEEAVTTINDNYLKFNRQESGVQSYGEMVDLLLAYYF